MVSEDSVKIIFGELPPLLTGLEKYLSMACQLKIFKGEVIDLAPCDSILYVKSGKLHECVNRLDTSTLDFAFFGSGTIVMQSEKTEYLALCDKVNICAYDNTIAYLFDREKFYEIICSDSQLFKDFTDFGFAYRQMLHQRLIMTSCLDADLRIIGLLNRLCNTVSENENGEYFIPCKLTQQEMADYLFMHVTTCNRIFASLKQQKIVHKTRKGFTIPHREKLNELLLTEKEGRCAGKI